MNGLRGLLDDAADLARVPDDIIERAQRGGRARRRRRQMLAAGVSVIAVLGVGAGAALVAGGTEPGPGQTGTSPTAPVSPTLEAGPPFPESCLARVLPVPTGYPPVSVATAVDPTGRFIVGRAYPGDGRPRILIWDGGPPGGPDAGSYSVTAVQMPGADAAVYDVNSRGWTVGYSFPDADDIDHTAAYLYHDGQMTRLMGGSAVATQVNDNGAVLGLLSDHPDRVAVWRSPDAEPQLLAQPADEPYGRAVQLREDGSVLGMVSASTIGAANGVLHAVVWRPDGAVVRLDWPVISRDGASAVGMGLGPAAQGDWTMLGAGYNDGVERTPMLWNTSTGEIRPVLNYGLLSMNSHGWYVTVTRESVFLISGGRRAPLLPPTGTTDWPRWPAAAALSDDGRTIAGYVSLSDVVAAVWQCS